MRGRKSAGPTLPFPELRRTWKKITSYQRGCNSTCSTSQHESAVHQAVVEQHSSDDREDRLDHGEGHRHVAAADVVAEGFGDCVGKILAEEECEQPGDQDVGRK